MVNPVRRVIEFLAPHECLLCRAEGELICSVCLPKAKVHKRPTCWRCNRITLRGQTCHSCRPSSALAGVTVASYYEGVVKELIQALKYQNAVSTAEVAAALIAASLPAAKITMVVSVPTTLTRRRQRGYDQARLIAKGLAARNGWPYRDLISRRGNSRQVGAPRRQRQEQARGAFVSATSGLNLQGECILLIDDVMTTGASMNECARVLKAAGATRVWGAVVAKH